MMDAQNCEERSYSQIRRHFILVLLHEDYVLPYVL